MCDTIVAFVDKERSFFAKNSDRDPGELQIIEFSQNPREEFASTPYFEPLDRYVETSFQSLQEIFYNFNNSYEAIISRPIWMWGAEMGVNEWGVAIGNEAVFSKEKVPADGLLGMDILRLALHNSKSAKEAKDFIIDLLERYPQGGDGGYSKSLIYHNSFLIKDSLEAYLLETSAKHWAVKKIDDVFRAISNSYSLRDDYDSCDNDSLDTDFKAKYENKLVSFFTKGDKRRRYSLNFLAESSLNLTSMKELLRSHINDGVNKKSGMNSICIHPGFLIKSETTSSFIVDYYRDKAIIWFTGSPNPCVSLFKPLIFSSEKLFLDFTDVDLSFQYSNRLKDLAKKAVKDYSFFQKFIKPLRNELEAKFLKLIYEGIEEKTEADLLDNCNQCYRLEEKYLEEIDNLLLG